MSWVHPWTQVLTSALQMISHNLYYNRIAEYHHSHFRDEDTESQRCEVSFPGHSAALRWKAYTEMACALWQAERDVKMNSSCLLQPFISKEMLFLNHGGIYVYFFHFLKEKIKMPCVQTPTQLFLFFLFSPEIKPGITYAEPLPQSPPSVSWHIFLLIAHLN